MGTTLTVIFKFNSGIRCTSCGTYCRLCDQSGKCLKCLQGFVVKNGICVECTENLCSCQKLSIAFVNY